MSGVAAEPDNETTDYRTTRQRAKRAKGGIRPRNTETTAQDTAEGKALRECVLPGSPD